MILIKYLAQYLAFLRFSYAKLDINDGLVLPCDVILKII